MVVSVFVSVADSRSQNAFHKDKVLCGWSEWLYFYFHGWLIGVADFSEDRHVVTDQIPKDRGLTLIPDVPDVEQQSHSNHHPIYSG